MTGKDRSKPLFEVKEELDSKGGRFVRLPRLHPFDSHCLDNRNGCGR